MRNKKGIAVWLVVLIILVIVAFGVFFIPFTSVLSDLIKGRGSSTACALSLMAGTDASNCPLHEVVISNDAVKVDDKKYVEKKLQSTQEMAKEALTKLMLECLSNGGGLNSRAFFTEHKFFEERVCLRCSKIDIDKNIGNIGGFTEYLRDNKVKESFSDKTYLEALTKNEEHLRAYMIYGAGIGLSPSNSAFVFTPGKEYTIFYLGIKKGYALKSIEQFYDATTGALLRAVFGIYDNYFIYITESENIPNICDRQVN